MGYKDTVSVSIHLMLQFICVWMHCWTVRIWSFNTSHVVVYLYHVWVAEEPQLFQYISCCSLSVRWLIKQLGNLSFNTSHVVVYRHCCFKCSADTVVSIHLMLQFIRRAPRKPTQTARFNTSHVVVYQKTGCQMSGRISSFNTSHVVVYPSVGSV